MRITRPPFDQIKAAFSDGTLDVGFGRLGEDDVISNRKIFLGPLDIDNRELVCGEQVHGARVAKVDELDSGAGGLEAKSAIKGADGLITQTPGISLAVFVADCFPIFLYDEVHRAIGICHAGWRGSYQRISQSALKAMEGAFGTDPSDVAAALGPGIRACCYVVGEELKEYFPVTISRRGGSFYLDLAKENIAQLKSGGIKEENIYDTGICTHCNEKFFSYRRQKEAAGRMMAVIMLGSRQ